MERRHFIKKSGQALLAVSTISITGSFLASCASDDDGFFDDGYYDNGYYDDGYYGDAQAIRDILMAANWKVGSYIDSGDDETSDYNGYTVDFKINSQVVATNGSNTNSGSWSVNGSGNELTLEFDGSPFDEFNDEWDIISVQPDRIELRDVSGGGSGTDILIFVKI